MPGADDYEASDGGPYLASAGWLDQAPGATRDRLLDGLAACVTRALASPRTGVRDVMDELGIDIGPGHAVTTEQIRAKLAEALR